MLWKYGNVPPITVECLLCGARFTGANVGKWPVLAVAASRCRVAGMGAIRQDNLPSARAPTCRCSGVRLSGAGWAEVGRQWKRARENAAHGTPIAL